MSATHVAQPVFVTPHAMRRYRERVRPTAGEYEAVCEILITLQGRMPAGAITRATAVSDAARTWVAVLEPPPPGKAWPSVSTIFAWRMFWYREDGRARWRRVDLGPDVVPPEGWLAALVERAERLAAWRAADARALAATPVAG